MKIIWISILILNFTLLSTGQNIDSSFEPSNESLDFNIHFGGAVVEIVENPLINADNSSDYVAKSYKGGYEIFKWGGVAADIEDGFLEIDNECIITFQVMAESKLGLVKLKLENSWLGKNSASIEFDHQISEIGAWEQVEFDISDLDTDYFNRIVLLFDFGSTDSDAFYFDNIQLVNYDN